MAQLLRTMAALMVASSLVSAPASAQQHGRGNGPPPHYDYWQNRRDPPPGHEFHPAPPQQPAWQDRHAPPPNWDNGAWRTRQSWLRRHGHDHDDNNSALGIIAGAILGYALGAAVVDSQEQQQYADQRLDDPAWIAYCARRYDTFDPYTATYLGRDGLRHYCR